MASEDHSRSLVLPQSHRCSIAITDEQKYVIENSEIPMVLMEWFGNAKSVPVKDYSQAAVTAFQEANQNALPPHMLTFYLGLTDYHHWIHDGTMVRVQRLSGYRIYRDVKLNDVDPVWLIHPCW